MKYSKIDLNSNAKEFSALTFVVYGSDCLKYDRLKIDAIPKFQLDRHTYQMLKSFSLIEANTGCRQSGGRKLLL